ncbi:MAG TPA: type II toxin-antitoxin system death-on-curing family toxin [Thermoanaerobaculia bacterium]|nr:type II toxin-antitoxin system death-on-curing family toxin [Thermoanaerobaculia bacterium]
MPPLFLSLDEALALHELQLRLFGGSAGVRDIGLLDSAIANVEATFDGELLHAFPFEMAAAYLYGICRNHPFVDGNKRTAAHCALTFLDMNGFEVDASEDDLYDLVIGVAEGRVSKAAVAVFFEQHATRR